MGNVCAISDERETEEDKSRVQKKTELENKAEERDRHKTPIQTTCTDLDIGSISSWANEEWSLFRKVIYI